MVDSTYLQNLLGILKLHNVSHIKMQGLEIEFHVEHSVSHNIPRESLQETDSTQIIADTIKKQEEAMPPDLRADSLMDQDKILNWSSPDQTTGEPELPLTGETPL